MHETPPMYSCRTCTHFKAPPKARRGLCGVGPHYKRSEWQQGSMGRGYPRIPVSARDMCECHASKGGGRL